MSRSRKIVFFFPSFASSDATAPLGILAVATPLERAGFEICLIDSTITPDFKKRVIGCVVSRDLGDYLVELVGIELVEARMFP